MTYKSRNYLFIFLIILFVVASALMIFYSIGWRFDFVRFRTTEPGMFYFKVWPRSAQIFIDQKLKKKTDFFFGETSIENLTAKEYLVEIKKDGYYSWIKNLEIKPRQATEIKDIVLVPTNPNFSFYLKGIKKIYYSDFGKKIVIQKDGSPWSLELIENDGNSYKLENLISEKTLLTAAKIKKNTLQISNLSFSPDLRKILIESKEAKYVLDISTNFNNLILLDFIPQNTSQIQFNPIDSNEIFVKVPNGKLNSVFAYDIVSKKKSTTKLEDIIDFYATDTGIYYINNAGNLLKTGFSFAVIGQLDEGTSLIKPLSNLMVYENSSILVNDNNTLYFFNRDKKTFDKVSENVSNVSVSPDYSKLAYYNNNEINVLFLKRKYDQPIKSIGDKVFLTRFSEKIGNVFWYADNYLAFNAGDKIKVIEIDDRDKINMYDLADFKSPDILWNYSDKKLFILSDGNIYISEKLTP